MTTRLYYLINTETGEIVAYTQVHDCDIDDAEILDCRLESAIDEDLIPDENYIWELADCNAHFGVWI